MANLTSNKKRRGKSKNQPKFGSLLNKPINGELISYVAQMAANVVPCDPDPPWPLSATYSKDIPPLEAFISHLVAGSNVPTSTFLTSLVYLARIKSRLPPGTRGFRCTRHRIFLASLILADKYVNDVCYKNSSWAHLSIMNWENSNFGFLTSEVTAAEKELLSLLDYNVRITQEDLQEQLLPLK
ncbi:hypothetical protein N657DRAFT_581745 [Parathielavia appendiculata]|uniref:Cyclin N-terminal domain-containing protein n=1 Tax=Parathielavia appendiculata TaxID=2587402 RepID=A0AAN6YZJ3_9PEZI|nr:hypothetical protein N657DRAFT_581745 [Parathielavia appendiculata]